MTSPANERGGHARSRRPFAPRPRDNGRHGNGPTRPARPRSSRPASCPARPPNPRARPSPPPGTSRTAAQPPRPAPPTLPRSPARAPPSAGTDPSPGQAGPAPQPRMTGAVRPAPAGAGPPSMVLPAPPASPRRRAGGPSGHASPRSPSWSSASWPSAWPAGSDGAIRRAHRPGVPVRLAAAAVRRRGQDDHRRAGYRHHGPAERLHATRRHPAFPVHEVSRPARRNRGRLLHGDGRSRPAGSRVDL